MSIAAAVRSRPRSFISSTALIVKRSSSSRVTGDSPAVAIPATASPAPSSVGKKASIVDRGGGAGRSLRVASVMIASVPWLPTKRWVSEYPATSLTFLPPVRMTVPSAITTSSDSTDSRVWPYLTQHSPPALVPRFPPIEHISNDAGSGG